MPGGRGAISAVVVGGISLLALLALRNLPSAHFGGFGTIALAEKSGPHLRSFSLRQPERPQALKIAKGTIGLGKLLVGKEDPNQQDY